MIEVLLLPYLKYALLVVWPLGRILRRAGFSPWLAGLVFVPLIGFLLVLMVLGHRPWPRLFSSQSGA